MGNNNSSNDNSSNGNSSICTGKNAPGLNQHCFHVGYSHGVRSTDPDSVSEGIDAAPCTLNTNANKCYAQGIVAGMHSNGDNICSNNDGGRRYVMHQGRTIPVAKDYAVSGSYYIMNNVAYRWFKTICATLEIRYHSDGTL